MEKHHESQKISWYQISISSCHFPSSATNHNDGFSDHTIAVNEQNERLILFPYIMYYLYQTMNGNALSLKNVRLKKFRKTQEQDQDSICFKRS